MFDFLVIGPQSVGKSVGRSSGRSVGRLVGHSVIRPYANPVKNSRQLTESHSTTSGFIRSCYTRRITLIQPSDLRGRTEFKPILKHAAPSMYILGVPKIVPPSHLSKKETYTWTEHNMTNNFRGLFHGTLERFFWDTR